MKKITDNIFCLDYTAKIMPGVHFPARTTFIKLANNELMIISPGPNTPAKIHEITPPATLYCIAPNAFHHQHLKAFHEAFPNVKIYGPASLLRKQPWLAGKLDLLDALPTHLTQQVSTYPVLGNPTLDETTFYCHASKTLILTDLLFNMRNPMPMGRALLLTLVGARNKIAQSKLIKSSTKDIETYKNAIQPLMTLDCDRIIVAHGCIIENKQDIKNAMLALTQSQHT